MNIKEKHAKRIKNLRSQKGLSQEALAFEANLDTKYMSDIECGKRNFSIQTLEKIVKALNVSVLEFYSATIF
ncbi:helix-turn-helix transcriptional regulator [Carboxylicivirga sediminis]|uniref:Helix-turn-helix transcriptional regulator n=1 Tax=Carboxylicivirga sediminis TaxID=2006564 RepID=A0A941F0X0_9BACT|nr:helix-turn-helix transcriptional regulator [Carboxylicivirga sediminis]MBR8534407.1 helix-turn-helix transcriptional regulator [Carboxylicivirga sediminis]